ncbi:MAG: tetratricopeptide repeat protein, partial [Bacteroidales bacterium]|nr:tetratricopeptide repeat protein [Bacteroidales bacterium]
MKTPSLFPQITLIVILFAGFISPSFSQESTKLYQKGLIKEEGEGSLQEAIEIYNQVVDDVSAERSLRAKALLHVGFCYEKLGQEKAKKTYKKLIAEFADQGDIVAIGKKKLAYLDAGSTVSIPDELIIRQVWAPAGDTYGVSPDGRYLSYIDWRAIELAVKDLKTGKTWNITDRGTWKPPMQFPDNSVWSPDSKQLAYYWFNDDTTELRIANIDGSGDRLLRNGTGYQTPWPVTWSPDGKYILGLAESEDDPPPENTHGNIVLVSVDDGSIRVIKSMDEHDQSDCCGDISPDSKYIIYPMTQEKGTRSTALYLFA